MVTQNAVTDPVTRNALLPMTRVLRVTSPAPKLLLEPNALAPWLLVLFLSFPPIRLLYVVVTQPALLRLRIAPLPPKTRTT
jgi:hypothetical protein